METHHDIQLLIRKYLQQECTVGEINELLNLFGAGKNEQVLKASITEYLEANSEFLSTDNYHHILDEVETSLLNRIQEVGHRRRTSYWPRWVAAASVVLAVLAGSYSYYTSNQTKDNTQLAAVNDIAPGKEGATLTLADGRKILIKDALSGKIAEQFGVRISKSADGEIIYEVVPDNSKILTYNTLTTTRGEQTRVRLPDGTLVFLNAESSLKYPTSFAGLAKRAVSLSGEGYFEVSKDKAHPFVVDTKGQLVEVLGTHFNINAYNNENSIKTTLLEGSVRISEPLGKLSKILKPGHQAKVVDNLIDISQVEVDDAVAWKNGRIMYDGEMLENIMEDVARWYDVDVVYKDETVKEKTFFVSVSRKDNVSKLLKLLMRTQAVTFEIKDKKIIVDKKKD